MIWAASCGHEVAAETLIGKGANLHARNADGRTALDWAARNGHRNAVAVLTRAIGAPEKATPLLDR